MIKKHNCDVFYNNEGYGFLVVNICDSAEETYLKIESPWGSASSNFHYKTKSQLYRHILDMSMEDLGHFMNQITIYNRDKTIRNFVSYIENNSQDEGIKEKIIDVNFTSPFSISASMEEDLKQVFKEVYETLIVRDFTDEFIEFFDTLWSPFMEYLSNI